LVIIYLGLFYVIVFVFDDLYFINLVVIVFCQPRFIVLLRFFLPAVILIFSVLAKRLAQKVLSNMTYLVSSGTLNLNLIESMARVLASQAEAIVCTGKHGHNIE